MSIAWPPKGAEEELDYALDWKRELTGDTIDSSTWIPPEGITVVSESFTDTMTIIWLSGGVAGQKYVFVNKIRTRRGRRFTQDISIKVIEK